MAVRSGAGNGVVVSLVVFVMTTVFLLVMTIVFYGGQNKQTQEREALEATLKTYASPSERSSDLFGNLEAAASRERQSVAGYINAERESLMRFVDGNGSTSMDELKSKLSRLGVEEDDTVRDVLLAKDRSLTAAEDEITDLNAQLGRANDEIREAEVRLADARVAHEEEVNAVKQQIAGYANASEGHRQELYEAIATVNESRQQLEDRYEARIRELENDNDFLNQERVGLLDRISQLQSRLNEDRIKPQNPETLVDGRVIDVVGTNSQVFIDRGHQDRIVLGMTFEVYEDAASIRADPRTGALPRGKGSLQVIKVAETTATCKITRAIPGRPIVRADIIANAVYDPDYKFKFLVHGKFDVDGDNRPSDAEAEYLRSQVIDWGGEIISGTELPGDLDFLVLGERPPYPSDPPNNASELEIIQWRNKRVAREEYDRLFEQASAAQIPILNANRFFILIGYTDR